MTVNTQQYIYVLQLKRPGLLISGPTEEETEAIEAHAGYLNQLSSEGTVLLAGRTQTTDENTFGMVIVSASSELAAQEIMRNDPAIIHNVMSGTLYPYKIAFLSPDIMNLESDN